ncbi:hypothetical protein NVP1253O_28 [Vibrio phage 1.253.O._10N.286.45.B12]|nr:hypothetical protein NVP1235O_28 [Vibrio phage 1.235.O._10N.261.52.B2]AUR98552.1 hypothetical protein NVP1253O_28 [Vibrio phage 1.253.O._10N.286.45.B12]
MEQIMQIGAKVEKQDAENFSSAISEIFTSAHENRIDQSVISTAINAFTKVFEVKQVTVTNSTFVGEDKRVIVDRSEQRPDGVVVTGECS